MWRVRWQSRRRKWLQRRASQASRTRYHLYKHDARRVIIERLAHWSAFYALSYGRVSIRNARARWGSCSSKGNLNFNYRLLFLSVTLIDYVVVHELCHLLEFNHSRAFWAQVARALPDYAQRRRALKRIRILG